MRNKGIHDCSNEDRGLFSTTGMSRFIGLEFMSCYCQRAKRKFTGHANEVGPELFFFPRTCSKPQLG
jgi:hypothetical protein